MAATTKPLWHSSVRSCTVFFGYEPALVDIRRDAAIDARRVAGRARVATDFALSAQLAQAGETNCTETPRQMRFLWFSSYAFTYP